MVNEITFRLCLGAACAHHLTPAKNRYARRKVRMRVLELSVSTLIAGTIVYALALAPLCYRLYATNPSILVFLAFNIFCSAHATLTMLAFSSDLGRSSLRLLRRGGAQYTVILIIVTNAALALGYAVGWITRSIYLDPEKSPGDLPFPGLLYELHERSPGELPYLAQVEAAGVTILLLLALSWLQIVISKSAWAEMALVIGSSAAAAFSPQVLPPLQSFLRTISDADWTIINQAPELVLALAIPAIKSFLGSEVEHITDPGTKEWRTCPSCDEPIEMSDRFCRACGSVLSDRQGSAP